TQEDVVEWWNDFRLKIDHKVSELKVYTEARLRLGVVTERPRDRAAFALVNGADPKWASDVSLREAYVDWRPGAWQLRFGQQIFTWGKNDLFAPADVLNPLDLRYDPLLGLVSPREAKVPVVAMNV